MVACEEYQCHFVKMWTSAHVTVVIMRWLYILLSPLQSETYYLSPD